MTTRYSVFLLAAALAIAPTMARAAAYSTPTVQLMGVSTPKLTLKVIAGASGTPQGFSMYWMTQSDYDDYGNVWPEQLTYPTLHWANFTGAPTLNTWDGLYTTYQLGPNQEILIELGDLEDEQGMTTNSPNELDVETDYVVCAFANGGGGSTRSSYSLNSTGATVDKPRQCVHSKGYWKNHPNQWPVSSLVLGTVSYTKAQLLQILNQPGQGNGLVTLAKQLIATKLNIANSADPAPIASEVAAADTKIGSLVVPPIGSGYLAPSTTSKLTQDLDDFNTGKTETTCQTTATQTSSWGRLKSLYR